MRTLTRWATKLYPPTWRNRYGAELDAVLEDIDPRWRDVCDIFGRALAMRCRALIHAGLPVWNEAFPRTTTPHLRTGVLIALIAHSMVLSFFVVASWVVVAPIKWAGPAAPSPPPPPAPPQEITDPRVFGDMPLVYSSLPLRSSENGGALFTRVVDGVGIYFPPLPDMGTTDRRRYPIRRIWPGRALEASVTQRVIPRYPSGTHGQGIVSVFLEYLIGTDGSVTVLRTSGPPLFADAARSALEQWRYRPLRFENSVVEVISRVEVRFDGEFVNTGD